MFAKSLEELGLHSSKSQPLLGLNSEPKMEASKSLGLGDLLTFLQKHFNQILSCKNPDFSFEFVGYEKDDLKLVSDIDHKEVGTWKTVNEKRLEKGMEPIDMNKVDNAADLPMNPQIVQLYQNAKQGGGFGMSDEGFADDDYTGGDEYQEGSDENENGETGSADNENGWDLLAMQRGSVNKSLSERKNTVRIVI
jgi:hypothetical protein